MGLRVTFEKSLHSAVNITLDGAVVGQLDATLGSQVALAIERGQSFAAVIEKAYPIYNDKFKQTGAEIDIKVEYLLEKGQAAIETLKCWRTAEPSRESHTSSRSFFTKVAGVDFEGRQRIVARCSEGESLILVRDPNNRFDKGAIKVMRLNGEQLGFLPAHVSRGGDATGLAFQMDHGSEYQCRIKNITGGGPGGNPGESLGVNIEITEREKLGAVMQVDASDAPSETTSETPSEAPPVAPAVNPRRTAIQPMLLWILAGVIIGCIVWAVFK